MISKKLSLNKVCIILATTILLLSVVMFSVLYILTKEMSVVFCSMAFCLLFLLCVTVFVILIRQKLTLFSEMLCCTLDEMMNGKIDISQVAEEENLFYKINHRLVRLYEVMQESKNSVASERADLQELISDISHQVKTPIANLKMVNATLLEQEVPSDKQREFLLASGTQLDKLDFLMQATVDKNFMDEVVQMLALGDKLQNMPNNLSGGQQQRVAIARALVSKPAIILADEPTGNLDSKTSSDVLGLLKVTSQKFHQTIVMITHNSEIAQLADRIVRIEDGKIVE